jgi:uncharacterized protein YjbI with pentapeptide repeats
MPTEDKLWLPPQSSKDQEKLDRLQNKRKKPLPKWTGFTNKTLWDWLQLLIVPLVLAVGGFWFAAQQNQTSFQLSEKQHQNDIQIATDQQEQALLQSYLDRISDLLLGNNTGKNSPTLAAAKSNDEISKAARARTLTTLERLDPKRKGVLLRFLYETKLISKSNTIIDLRGADLSRADLLDTDLSGANLNDVDLTNANLQAANLSEASLSGTDLSGDNLQFADLREATLAPLTFVSPGRTDIRYTFLIDADLSNADLDGANLEYVDLTGANLVQAQLRGTNLKRAVLKGAKYNTKAMPQEDPSGHPIIDPNGTPVILRPTSWDPDFNPRAAGAICVDC